MAASLIPSSVLLLHLCSPPTSLLCSDSGWPTRTEKRGISSKSYGSKPTRCLKWVLKYKHSFRGQCWLIKSTAKLGDRMDADGRHSDVLTSLFERKGTERARTQACTQLSLKALTNELCYFFIIIFKVQINNNNNKNHDWRSLQSRKRERDLGGLFPFKRSATNEG